MLEIDANLSIPENELLFTASGSSGPGGQNVNKVSTRVTLWFDVLHSASLTEEQKDRISRNLAARINKKGWLRITVEEHRSQAANRKLAREKFCRLLFEALKERPVRKKTRVPKRSRRRRLENKKQRSRKKKLRSNVPPDSE